MAEKPEKKGDEKPAPAAAKAQAAEKKEPAAAGGSASMLRSTPMLLGVVMVLEGALLFAAFKMFGGSPKSVQGADLVASEGGHGHRGGPTSKPSSRKHVELPVLSFKAPNSLRGRTYLYDVSVFVAVRSEHKEKVEASLKEREATVQDRIRTIIAQSDPEKLGGGSEPGLETLRRQVKYQLEELIGEGLIDEVLIPRCIPYRAEF